MTKGTVRALDTAEDFLVGLGHEKPIRWGITGASKRGWTAWTHAAVDFERVIFVSPVWLDNLNLIESSHHHFRSLGGWTMQYVDYYIEGFTRDIDDPGQSDKNYRLRYIELGCFTRISIFRQIFYFSPEFRFFTRI